MAAGGTLDAAGAALPALGWDPKPAALATRDGVASAFGGAVLLLKKCGVIVLRFLETNAGNGRPRLGL